ncbi:MAG: T9SS type A sorting domain-containing protein [Bacteroidota bacterium]
MRLATLIALVLATAAHTSAQPVPYYGQDSRFPTQSGPPYVFTDGAPLAARQAFLSALDPLTIQNQSFESFTATSAYPANNANFSQALTFSGAVVGQPITVTASGTSAGFVNQNPDTENGVYPTDGDNFLFGRQDVEFDFGSTPVNAFGFYLNDVETVDFVLLILDPVGPGAVDTLRYGPIPNTGSTSGTPGNGQLNFVGFIDKNTDYETVTVGFPGVGNEGFGFDELVVGELPQVIAEQATVPADEIADAPGWRLLSVPVYGVTAFDLSLQNLVQGLPSGGSFPGQYPDARPNLYEAYNGGSRYDYVPASSSGSEFVPGRGFWWYWYDLDLDPDDNAQGGGTSKSVALDGFALSAVGFPVSGDTTLVYDDNVNSASDSGLPSANPDPTTVGAPAGTVSPADDDVYMIGNPYPRPFAVESISATGGTLQDAMFIWNPTNQGGASPSTGPDPGQDGPGSYEIVFQTPPDAIADSIAVWQGLLAEVDKTLAQVGSPVSFSFASAGSQGSGSPPFYGKTASAGAERYLHLSLYGTTASRREVRDAATYIRFREDASDAWDRFDATKPISPAGGAGLALLGERDGDTRHQAVLSLSATDRPDRQRWAVAHLAFAADEAGTYTLTWDGAHGRGLLRDREAGRTIRLHREAQYTFSAEAGSWSDRFTLVFFPPETDAPQTAKTDTAPREVIVGEPLPNPTVGDFRMEIQADAEVVFSMYDALGRRVREVTLDAAEASRGALVTLPASGLAPGAYVVRVEAPGLQEARRVTIVR